jgi:hypothetical protein
MYSDYTSYKSVNSCSAPMSFLVNVMQSIEESKEYHKREDERLNGHTLDSHMMAGQRSRHVVSRGKIVVVVRSERSPVETYRTSFPDYLANVAVARSFTTAGRLVRYDYVLNSEQERLVHEAKLAATRLGVDVEIRDLSKESALGKIWSRLARGSRSPKFPSVTLSGWAFEHFAEINDLLRSPTFHAGGLRHESGFTKTSSECSCSSSPPSCTCV